MGDDEIREARELLGRLVAAVESGALVASGAELAALRGALAVLDSLNSAHETTV